MVTMVTVIADSVYMYEPDSSPQSENCSVSHASLCSFDAITYIHTNRPLISTKLAVP